MPLFKKSLFSFATLLKNVQAIKTGLITFLTKKQKSAPIIIKEQDWDDNDATDSGFVLAQTPKQNYREPNRRPLHDDDDHDDYYSDDDDAKQPLNKKKKPVQKISRAEISGHSRHKIPFFLKITSALLFIILIMLMVYIVFFAHSKTDDTLSISQNNNFETVISPVSLSDTPVINTEPLEQQQEFDFSFLNMKYIEPLSLLPKKYARKDKDMNYEDFLPKDALVEKSPFSESQYDKLTLPALKDIGFSLLPTWKRYSALHNPVSMDIPTYAVVLNYDPVMIPVSSLPDAPLTISVEGYYDNMQEIVNQLRAKGYEVILELPLEVDTKLGIDAGIKPLEKKMSFDEMRNRIDFHSNSVTGHIGFKNRLSSDFMASQYEVSYMMNLLKDKGFTFLEVLNPHDTFRSVATLSADAIDVPSYSADVVIEDLKRDFPPFFKKISITHTGVAVVNATPENVVLLSDMLKKLDDKNIVMVPLSHIYIYKDMQKQIRKGRQ